MPVRAPSCPALSKLDFGSKVAEGLSASHIIILLPVTRETHRGSLERLTAQAQQRGLTAGVRDDESLVSGRTDRKIEPSFMQGTKQSDIQRLRRALVPRRPEHTAIRD